MLNVTVILPTYLHAVEDIKYIIVINQKLLINSQWLVTEKNDRTECKLCLQAEYETAGFLITVLSLAIAQIKATFWLR